MTAASKHSAFEAYSSFAGSFYFYLLFRIKLIPHAHYRRLSFPVGNCAAHNERHKLTQRHEVNIQKFVVIEAAFSVMKRFCQDTYV